MESLICTISSVVSTLHVKNADKTETRCLALQSTNQNFCQAFWPWKKRSLCLKIVNSRFGLHLIEYLALVGELEHKRGFEGPAEGCNGLHGNAGATVSTG